VTRLVFCGRDVKGDEAIMTDVDLGDLKDDELDVRINV